VKPEWSQFREEFHEFTEIVNSKGINDLGDGILITAYFEFVQVKNITETFRFATRN